MVHGCNNASDSGWLNLLVSVKLRDFKSPLVKVTNLINVIMQLSEEKLHKVKKKELEKDFYVEVSTKCNVFIISSLSH